jgi:hypothetical protein
VKKTAFGKAFESINNGNPNPMNAVASSINNSGDVTIIHGGLGEDDGATA